MEDLIKLILSSNKREEMKKLIISNSLRVKVMKIKARKMKEVVELKKLKRGERRKTYLTLTWKLKKQR